MLASGDEIAIVVADSGSPKVDQLVAALVSRVPAPISFGGKIPGDSVFAGSNLLNSSGRCATKEVEAAFQELKALTPKDFRFLVAHSGDDRYSYSMIGPWGSPTMSGWINYPVGHAIDEILSNEVSPWLGGYKSRKGADGKAFTPPGFTDYVDEEGGYDAWATSVAPLSRKEIDLRFLRWCIDLEKKRGFDNDEERSAILARYNAKIKEVEQGVAPQSATRSESESEGGDKPQPESKPRPR